MIASGLTGGRRLGAGLLGLGLALGTVGGALVAPAAAAGGALKAHGAKTPDPVLGAAKVQADFNGDGYGDLAVITRTELDEDGEIPTVQAMTILYGSASGLTTAGRQQIVASDLPGGAIPLGSGKLVAGDFNGDGASELVIGVPGAKTGKTHGGAVYVVPGSSTGLKVDKVKVWSQATAGVRGAAENGDQFGFAVAAADFGGGPEDDVAIGALGERTGKSNKQAGIVQVLFGSAKGLTATGDQVWSQGTKGIAGVNENGDQFGRTLVAGNFDGKRHADLAIGVPSEGRTRAPGAGTVTVLYSSASRLSATGSQVWSQDSPGVSGVPQRQDFFGNQMAAGTFSNPGRDDLAIAAPGEVSDSHPDRGVVQVLRSSSTGLTATGGVLVTLPSVGGSGDTSHRFGTSLLAADFGANPVDGRYGDLLIGSTGDFNDPLVDSYLLYGGPSGFSAAQTVAAHADSAAADFDGTGGASSYADLVAVREIDDGIGGDDEDDQDLEVSVGQSSGLSQGVAHTFAPSDLAIPANPRSRPWVLDVSSAGSR